MVASVPISSIREEFLPIDFGVVSSGAGRTATLAAAFSTDAPTFVSPSLLLYGPLVAIVFARGGFEVSRVSVCSIYKWHVLRG